jgi:hypothetical protein
MLEALNKKLENGDYDMTTSTSSGVKRKNTDMTSTSSDVKRKNTD